MDPRLLTDRLVLRGWRVEDAAEALGVYGHPEVARWLSPEMDLVPDVVAMRLLLQQWIAEDARTAAPAGRFAIERRDDGRLLGGAILLRLPPGLEDLELGWQLHPQVWGCGYASETTRVLANWAFSHDVAEIFAVVRPGNTRAASTVRRNGMEWVGETGKYFGLDLQVFRLRRADFDPTPPPSDRTDPAITTHSRRVGVVVQVRRPRQDLPPDPSAPRCNTGAEWCWESTNGRRPRGVWGDVRTAQVIGLPGAQNAPRCSVSASAHEDRVLTQTRGA